MKNIVTKIIATFVLFVTVTFAHSATMELGNGWTLIGKEDGNFAVGKGTGGGVVLFMWMSTVATRFDPDLTFLIYSRDDKKSVVLVRGVKVDGVPLTFSTKCATGKIKCIGDNNVMIPLAVSDLQRAQRGRVLTIEYYVEGEADGYYTTTLDLTGSKAAIETFATVIVKYRELQ